MWGWLGKMSGSPIFVFADGRNSLRPYIFPLLFSERGPILPLPFR
jgi:hypothetical protein